MARHGEMIVVAKVWMLDQQVLQDFWDSDCQWAAFALYLRHVDGTRAVWVVEHP